jgi:hypothetical protein
MSFRLRRRLAQGFCPHCGYATVAVTCSECGLTIPDSPTPIKHHILALKPYALGLLAVVASWLGMQAVHELGHIFSAYITGGNVVDVGLHPLEFSRTEVTYGTSPLAVIWMGPLVGIAIPVTAWLLASALRCRDAFLLRFFAGFCSIANGVYIGLGSFDGIGDAGDIMRHGCSQWSLIAFGIATVPAGFWLWHGLAPRFGLGKDGDAVRASTLIGLILLIGALLTLGFLVGGIEEPSI